MTIGKTFFFMMALVSSLFLSGCVGTVKDASSIKTKALSVKTSGIVDYPGITSVKAIANSKVDVFFPPITGVDSDEISYVIRYSGQIVPTYVQAAALRPDYRGLLKYTVTGLRTNTLYDFTIQARNIKSNVESTNNVAKSVTTFSNVTANFAGITQVRNLNGANGLNGLEVFWNEAEVLGNTASPNDIDPTEFQITVINSTSLNPGNMNDTSFSEPRRKTYSIAKSKRSAVVNGLSPGTKYFLQVRAIHYGVTLNSSDTSYKKEENTNYFEISTYTDDIASLKFDNSSFTTTYPAGSNGLYSLNTRWASPIGNFDHYRLYYAINDGTISTNVQNYLNTATVNPFCFGAELNNSNIFCEYIDYNKINFSLAGLYPNTKYNLMLAVCLTTDCIKSKRAVSNSITHTTTPSVASFSGILSIDVAKNLQQLDKIFLNYTQPDFTSGNIQGLIVEYFGSDSSNTSPIALNNSDIINTSSLTVDYFDYTSTDAKIAITGIDPASAVPYCFLVYPYTNNNNGTKNFFKTGLTPKCIVPAIAAPTLSMFPGIDMNPQATFCTSTLADKFVSLNWDEPTSGVFENYELYYAKNITTFSFGSAIDPNNAAYTKIILNSSQTSIELRNLEPGATYKFGILTSYTSINGVVRSEFNSNIKTCVY